MTDEERAADRKEQDELLDEWYRTEQRNARMTKDNVNSPSHYTQAGIECIDAITAAVSGKSGIEAVCVANVIKYLWRYELKNGVEDVKKAQWYLNRLVSEMDKPALSQTKGINIGAGKLNEEGYI